MQLSPRFLLSLSLVVAAGACTDDPDPPGPMQPGQFVPPTSAAGVQTVYDQLGTCNGSTIGRGLFAQTRPEENALWTTPAADPATEVVWRAPTGWSRVAIANQISLGGNAEIRDPACQPVNRVVTPAFDAATMRHQDTHVLFYLDEAEHPYTAYPATAVEARRGRAPLRLRGYLNVTSYVREITSSGGILRKDIVEQHLPMYIACERPFEIETGTTIFQGNEVTRLDRALCDNGRELDGDPELEYACVSERGRHVDNNVCTFVVDGRTAGTLDGASHPMVFGGTIKTGVTAPTGAYDIDIDRFAL